jgi:hypothetical protein
MTSLAEPALFDIADVDETDDGGHLVRSSATSLFDRMEGT